MLNETIAKEDEIKYMKNPLSERTLSEYKPMGSTAIIAVYMQLQEKVNRETPVKCLERKGKKVSEKEEIVQNEMK